MDIKTVGVVGFGIMGSGIAQVCAQSGYSVIVSDVNSEFITKGLASINSFLSKGVEKGKVTPEQKEVTLKRITGTTDINGLKECDVVIEAVNENLELKKKIFNQLGKICPEHTIFGTNTSVLSVIEIAAASCRPENVVGMHFFIPPPLMKPVELVKTLLTSDQTLATGQAFLESIGKEVIITKDLPGFIVDRISIASSINAVRLLESGVGSVENIDKAITMGLNHPLGPFALMDLVGLDILVAGAKALHDQTGDPQFILPVTVSKMFAAGWLGRKTGKGFYDYRKSDKK